MGFLACKNFENRLRFDEVTESLKVGTFFETQCRKAINDSLSLKAAQGGAIADLNHFGPQDTNIGIRQIPFYHQTEPPYSQYF